MARNLLALAIVLVSLALIVWSGFQNHYGHRQVAQVASVTPAGAEASDPQEESSPLVGRPAPDFALRDLAGRRVRLADYRGKAVLLNFWATWCTPCQAEMPWFIDLERRYERQGFTILGIDKDYPEDLAKVPGFVKKMSLNYPVLYGDAATYNAYGCCDYLPMSYYIDRKGVIRVATIGLSERDEVEANIQRLLGGTSPPPDSPVRTAAATALAPLRR
jgi:peroxiredoxin